MTPKSMLQATPNKSLKQDVHAIQTESSLRSDQIAHESGQSSPQVSISAHIIGCLRINKRY
ncbi:hypothetical protein ACLOJK_013835 [Asimina triloba]